MHAMAMIDRAFGWLLVIGAALHAYGSLTFYGPSTVTLVWALAGSLAAFLLAAINLMRVNRRHDRTLAWVSFVGALCWCAVALAFGVAIQRIADPRVLYHAIVALALAAFSVQGALRRNSI
jgi:hypothetical protein